MTRIWPKSFAKKNKNDMPKTIHARLCCSMSAYACIDWRCTKNAFTKPYARHSTVKHVRNMQRIELKYASRVSKHEVFNTDRIIRSMRIIICFRSASDFVMTIIKISFLMT